MQITLNQEEIHAAVEHYVRNQITIADNQAINIDFTAGRGPNGLSATLDIRPAAVAAAPSKPVVHAVETKADTPGPVGPVGHEGSQGPEGKDEAEPETDTGEDTSAEEKTKPAQSGGSIFSRKAS